jgi:protein PXR1
MKKIKMILLAILCAILCVTACTGQKQKEEETKVEKSKEDKKEVKTKKKKKTTKDKKEKKKNKENKDKKEKQENKELESTEEAKVEKDVLAGTAWNSDNDNSYWVFNEDGTFYWYKDKGVTDDNYFGGSYKSYSGEAVFDSIGDVDPYLAGITQEELLKGFNNADDYKVEDSLYIDTTYNTYLLDGVEKLSQETKNSYYGFLSEDGKTLSIVNMSTGSLYNFSRDN